MDERSRFSRRRPSDADITASHNALTAPIPEPEIPEPVGGDAGPSLPDPVETQTSEATSGDRPDRSPERERVRAALRQAFAGRGRGARASGMRPPMARVSEHDRVAQAVGRRVSEIETAETVLGMSLSPEARERVTEAQDQRVQLVRDETVSTFGGTEEFRGLPLTHADPHWSERPNRGHRYADPERTDQE